MNNFNPRNKIDNAEMTIVNQLIQALDIDVDERGVLSQSHMTLTIMDNKKFKTLAVPVNGACLGEDEVYFQPLTNNKHNKTLISIFLEQYPGIADINFEGANVVFLDTQNKTVHTEIDTINPKEGVAHAILNYISTV